MSSTSIVIKCLSDTKSTNTPHGAITIGTLILQVAPGPLTGGNPGTRHGLTSVSEIGTSGVNQLADVVLQNRGSWDHPACRQLFRADMLCAQRSE